MVAIVVPVVLLSVLVVAIVVCVVGICVSKVNYYYYYCMFFNAYCFQPARTLGRGSVIVVEYCSKGAKLLVGL